MTAHEGCTPESGTCVECVSACSVKPGWFLPGEAERAAEHLGITLEELFRTKLAVDWWEGTNETEYQDIFVLSPAVIHGTPGIEFPAMPWGRCVFLTQDERCSIHEAKPFECRQHWCGEEDDAAGKRHLEVALAWRDHQDQLTKLLGREPESEEYGGSPFGFDWLDRLYE